MSRKPKTAVGEERVGSLNADLAAAMLAGWEEDELPTEGLDVAGLPIADMSAGTSVALGSYQLLRVPLNLIRDNPYQYRQEITPESVEDLVEQFRERGSENALEQFPKATTREEAGQTVYVLINGHRRKTAWGIAFPNEAMPLAVKPGITDRDLIFGGLVENLSRVNVSEVEAARGMQAFLEIDPKMTQQKLAGLFNLSRQLIAKKLQLLTLPMSLQEENRAGRLSLRAGVALVRFVSIPGAAEHAYQQLSNAGLTVEEVEKRGWELLRDWSGWETHPMPPEAAEILLPKITTYSAVTLMPASQVQAEYTVQNEGAQVSFASGRLAYQSNLQPWVNTTQPEKVAATTPARPLLTIVPPSPDMEEFKIATPVRASLPEVVPYEVAELGEVATTPTKSTYEVAAREEMPEPFTYEIAENRKVTSPRTTLQDVAPYEVAEFEVAANPAKPTTHLSPSPSRRAHYEAVEAFHWKLKGLLKSKQVEPVDPTLRLAFGLLVGMGIATGETAVVKKIISPRWKQLGGVTLFPTQTSFSQAWQWTQNLSLETLALLAGELVIEQWKWEQDNFPNLEDTQTLGWLEEFLKTLP